MTGLSVRSVERLLLRRGDDTGLARDVETTQDASQRISQFVRHHRLEVSPMLTILHQFFRTLPQCHFQPSAIGHVFLSYDDANAIAILE